MVVLVAVLVATKSDRRRHVAAEVSGAAAQALDDEANARASRLRAAAWRSPSAPDPGATSSEKNPGTVATRQILKEVRARIASRAGLRQPIEAQVNSITDYLRGILVGIRAIDPSVIGALRAEYEGALCGSSAPADVEVLVFTKLAVMQPDIASPRSLNCAIERRQTEDIVMWSLLDAWSAGGQTPLATMPTLKQRVSDQRTLERLRTPEEQRAEIKALQSAAGGPDDRAGPRASRPVRERFSQRGNAE